MRSSFLLFFIFACAISGTARGATFSVAPTENEEQMVITIEGEIVSGDENKFREISKKLPDAIILLKSPGGLIEPAMEIGRMIWYNDMGTYVEDADCASACALIWLAGNPRAVSTNGRIGFHSVYYKNVKSASKESSVGNALVGAYLAGLGLGPRVIAYATAESPMSMRWLTEDDASDIGLNVLFLDREFRALDLFNSAVELTVKSEGFANKEAVSLYMQSARIGFAGAQNNLGDIYETGNGVEIDLLAAVHWYTRAAERGEPTAYVSLATILAKSEDVQVRTDALKFAALAVAKLPEGFNKEAAFKLVSQISDSLPLENRELALKLAKAWRPLYQETSLMSDDPTPE